MGTIFSAGGVLGDGTGAIGGSDSGLYTPDVSIYSPPDNSQYTDAGQDPTGGGGGDWASTLGTVVNDAFKAYTIASTPTSYRAAATSYRAAALDSPAAIAAKKEAQTISTLVMVGAILVVIVVLYFIFKK